VTDPKRTLVEQRIAVLQTAALTALSALPPFGGSVAFAIAETVTRRRLDRVEEVGQRVTDELGQLHTRLADVERRLEDERVVELVVRALAGAADSSREQKRRAFSAAIVSTVTATEAQEEEQRYFVELIERMRPVHFAVLQIYASDFEDTDARTLADLLDTDADREIFDELATMAATDLFDWGLIQVAQTMYGHWPVRDFAVPSLKPLGSRFVDFLRFPAAEAMGT
jgi:hypothetical protein